LQVALQLASQRGSRLRIVHVFDDEAYPGAFDYDEYGGSLADFARKVMLNLLEGALRAAQAAGITADARLLEAGGRRFGETVAEEARAWRADLVVVGSHGRRGMERALLGSGAEQVVRLAPVPVLIVRKAAALPDSR
jgi:nucleotide-binding universal stress UspA family protein